MRRTFVATFLAALVAGGALLTAADDADAWSDGVGGSSGAVPEHLRECAEGFDYCKVKVSYCGGCHGTFDDMRYQRPTGEGEPVNVPVIDRINAEIWINGDKDNWEYEPQRTYVVDIYIEPWNKQPNREPGTYGNVGFTLNASAGDFAVHTTDPASSKVVRVTAGNFSHQGSQNPNARVCRPDRPTECRPYGQTVDDESDWAGELTNTRQGSNVDLTAKPDGGMAYHYRALWHAPPKQEPNGVAFVMSYMIANGDGVDSCVYVVDQTGCNSTKGYSDQDNWDWWSVLIPRKILCEKGMERAQCEKDVLAFVVPPPPPVNTGGTGGTGGTDEDPNGSPGIGPGAMVVLLAVALVRWHGRRRRDST